MKVLSRLLLLALLIASLGLFGCEGDDGDDGAPGVAGPAGPAGPAGEAGPPGPGAEVTPVEACGICHDDGAIADAGDSHAVTGEVSFSVVTPPAAAGNDVVVGLNIKVDGANDNSFTTVSRAVIFNGVTQYDFRPRSSGAEGAEIVGTPVNGNYTLRIKPSGTLPLPSSFVGGNTQYYFRLQSASGARASVSAHDAGFVRPVLVSDQACKNCHGDFTTGHHYNPFLVSNCVACHGAENAPFLELPALIHGIHNSHNMPSGHFAFDGEEWSVTYPTYMNNCSVCHDTTAGANAAVNTVVDYAFCMGCHENWTSFGDHTGVFGGVNHNSFTANCNACHGAGVSNLVTVADFHNGLRTERSGLIWDGRDVSVDEGAKVDMQITGITRSGDNLSITWTAAYNGAAVNPCNTTVAAGAPIFHAGGAANAATGQAASNLSFLKGFGQGDDWVNEFAASSPGQASAVNLTTANTTCAGNVATTVVPLTAAEQTSSKNGRGILALQGKAQVQIGVDANPATAGTQNVIQVRSKTPTREYVVATGALPADTRREIVDTAACLKCHVGSLYQHGGNRIDNVDMCVICHNEASTDAPTRRLDGVDATEAYDGQVDQTYGFKSFLHAVHSAGETGKITMCYRTNGVYVWGADEADIPNWPGTGTQTVYGSVPAGTNTAGTSRTHNFHAPTYPRALNDCAACHKPGTQSLPDQSIAVATTVDAKASLNGQVDDVLEGPAAAACMSCHQSGESYEQSVLKAHAYQNGWYPAVFDEGRKTIIDAAK